MADIQHKSITGLDAAHPPFYASESDPTNTLGAHRVWLKPSTGVIKRRNAANTAWEDISIEGTSAGSAPELANLSDVDLISTPPADGEALVFDDATDTWIPGSVAAGSVDAADVAYAGGTGMSATNVESAIDELANEKANDSALTAHVDDTADAHDATAISYAGGTGMSATHVEGAIDELAAEKANDSALTAHIGDTTDAHDASAISVLDSGNNFTATDVEAALAEEADARQAHEADTSDAHDASAISVLDTAAQYTATNVEDALAEVLDGLQAHETDATDAHDASAISIVDTGAYFTSTHVEGALQELGAGGGGGGVADLDDLTDVVISSPATDQVIKYNGTNWINGTSPGGGSGNISGAYDIEANTSYTDAGMSDEFASGTLDAKWTASVSSGTITFPGQPGTGVYDLTSRSGTLLLQPAYSTSASQGITLRQADGLTSGESLVLSCALPYLAKYTTTTYTTLIWGLNSSTTTSRTGTYQQMYLLVNSNTENSNLPSLVARTDAGIQRTITLHQDITQRVYLRFTRATVNSIDSFVWMYSMDGTVWSPFWQSTAANFTTMWIVVENNTQTNPSIAPVYPLNWIRHVASTAHDLW